MIKDAKHTGSYAGVFMFSRLSHILSAEKAVGVLEVDETGTLAGHIIPGKMVPGQHLKFFPMVFCRCFGYGFNGGGIFRRSHAGKLFKLSGKIMDGIIA